jgi:hypothetical protein
MKYSRSGILGTKTARIKLNIPVREHFASFGVSAAENIPDRAYRGSFLRIICRLTLTECALKLAEVRNMDGTFQTTPLKYRRDLAALFISALYRDRLLRSAGADSALERLQ